MEEGCPFFLHSTPPPSSLQLRMAKRRRRRRSGRRKEEEGAEDNKEMAEETFLRPLGGLLGASRRPKGYRRATEMLPKAAGRLRVRLMVGAPRYDS